MPETEKMSPEDLRDELLAEIRSIVLYWARLPDIDRATGTPLSIEGRCDGVAFSILTLLDGASSMSPFDLIARVHPDDDDQSRADVVISDMLHEHYVAPGRGHQ